MSLKNDDQNLSFNTDAHAHTNTVTQKTDPYNDHLLIFNEPIAGPVQVLLHRPFGFLGRLFTVRINDLILGVVLWSYGKPIRNDNKLVS